MKTLVFFDFDGTIISNDSIKLFYKSLYKNYLIYIYYNYFICYKEWFRFIVKKDSYFIIKNKLLEIHTSKFSDADLFILAETFTSKILVKYFYQEALNKIEYHKKLNHEIVIVSASYNFILHSWCKKFNIKLITNETKLLNGKRSINNVDVNFKEKVVRIQHEFNLSDFDEIYAYGDSNGDLDMFSLANKYFFKPFNK